MNCTNKKVSKTLKQSDLMKYSMVPKEPKRMKLMHPILNNLIVSIVMIVIVLSNRKNRYLIKTPIKLIKLINLQPKLSCN